MLTTGYSLSFNISILCLSLEIFCGLDGFMTDICDFHGWPLGLILYATSAKVAKPREIEIMSNLKLHAEFLSPQARFWPTLFVFCFYFPPVTHELFGQDWHDIRLVSIKSVTKYNYVSTIISEICNACLWRLSFLFLTTWLVITGKLWQFTICYQWLDKINWELYVFSHVHTNLHVLKLLIFTSNKHTQESYRTKILLHHVNFDQTLLCTS